MCVCVCAGGTVRSFSSLHLFIAAYSFCKHIKNVLGNRNLKPYYTEGARKNEYIYIHIYPHINMYVCVCIYKYFMAKILQPKRDNVCRYI